MQSAVASVPPMFLMFVMVFLLDYFFSSVHVLGELYCDYMVCLWPAMGLLVGLPFFEVSLNFRLVDAWAGGFGLSAWKLWRLPLAFIKDSSNSSSKRWESVSLANLGRSLYSLLTPDNMNFFLIDTIFWLACPDNDLQLLIFVVPFVCKMLGSWESNFIKQPVIFDILRWNSCSFISVLLTEGDTGAKKTRFTTFTWANIQFSGGWP